MNSFVSSTKYIAHDDLLNDAQISQTINHKYRLFEQQIAHVEPEIAEKHLKCDLKKLNLDSNETQETHSSIITNVVKDEESSIMNSGTISNQIIYLKYDSPQCIGERAFGQPDTAPQKIRLSTHISQGKYIQPVEQFEKDNIVKTQTRKLARYQAETMKLVNNFNVQARKRRDVNVVVRYIETHDKLMYNMRRSLSSNTANQEKSSSKSIELENREKSNDKTYELENIMTGKEFENAFSEKHMNFKLCGDEYLFSAEYMGSIRNLMNDFEMLTKSDKILEKLFWNKVYLNEEGVYEVRKVSNSTQGSQEKLQHMEKLIKNRREELNEPLNFLRISWQDEIRMLDELIRQVALDDWNFALLLKYLQMMMADEIRQKMFLIDSLFDKIVRSAHKCSLEIKLVEEHIQHLQENKEKARVESINVEKTISKLRQKDEKMHAHINYLALKDEKDRLNNQVNILKDFVEKLNPSTNNEYVDGFEMAFSIVNDIDVEDYMDKNTGAILNTSSGTRVSERKSEYTTADLLYEENVADRLLSNATLNNEAIQELHDFIDSNFKLILPEADKNVEDYSMGSGDQ